MLVCEPVSQHDETSVSPLIDNAKIVPLSDSRKSDEQHKRQIRNKC